MNLRNSSLVGAPAYLLLCLLPLLSLSSEVLAESYKGNIKMEAVKGTPNEFKGVRFTFDESFDVYRKKLKITNSHLEIRPQMPLEVQWINEKTLEVLWVEAVKPDQEIAITLKKIPLASGQLVLPEDKRGPYSLKTPPLTLESIALAHGEANPVVYLHWNYKIPVDQLRAALTAAHVLDGKTRQLRAHQITSIYPLGGESQDQTITIADPALWRGYLSLSLSRPLTISGRSYKIGNLPRAKLGKTVPMEISWTSTTETGSQFSITVYCEAQRQSEDYYKSRNCTLDEGAKDFIMVDPQVDFAIIPHYDHFQLVGAFQPATNYRFTFLPGLRSDDATITSPVSKTVRPPDLNAKFRFSGKARYLPEDGEPVLIYETTNVPEVKFSVSRILPQNIVYWLTQDTEEAKTNVAETIHEEKLKPQGRKNLAKLDRYQVDPKLLTSGIYAVEAKDQYSSTLDRAVFVRTDIAAVVKQDRDDIMVWTRSLKDMTLKGAVNVEAYGYANQKLASCNTGLFSGECRLKAIMKQPVKPYVIVLKADRDISYLKFDDLQIDDQRVHAGTRSYPSAEAPVTGYVYPSRGVYRPGEQVNIAAVMQTAGYQPAQSTPLQWKVQNARGKIIREVATTTNEFGMTELGVTLPGSAPTGRWQVDVYTGATVVASGEFLVEDFVPERIGLSIDAKVKRTLKSEATFDLDAKYLFGPPVAGGSYKVSCSIEPAWDSIPGRGDFKTGTHKRKKYLAVNLDAISGTLDGNGKAQATCEYGNYRDSFPSVMKVKAQAEVAEAGSGRVTYKTSTVLAAKSKNVIGLKDLSSTGKQISAEGRIFTLKGDADTSFKGKIQVEIFQLQRHWIYGHDDQFGYSRWHAQEVLVAEGNPQMVNVEGGSFTVALTPSQDYGGYLIRATDPNNKMAAADLEVSLGFRWYWWDYYGEDGEGNDPHKTPKPKAPDEIRVNLSKAEAAPGETLKLEFEAPFAGYGLLTTETDLVETSQWITVQKGPQSFNVSVPNRLPNAYFSLLVSKNPNEKGRFIPARAWGAASVKITPQGFDLAPKLTIAEKVRPGEEFTVELDTGGTPAAYTVAVVDEGILQLTNFASPDPLKYFFEPRRLGVNTYDTVGWAFSDQTPSGKVTGGGGDYAEADGGGGGRVSPVQVVSLWQGVAKTDANGKAKMTFKTPPFQGSVRVMAVASGAKGVGAVQKSVRVRDPLVVQSTLPRFFSVDDTIEIPVQVTNMTGESRKISVAIEASDHLELLDRSGVASINNDKSRTFTFKAKVKALAGTANVKVTAKAGKIFETVEPFTIPIIPQTPMIISDTSVPYQPKMDLSELIPAHMMGQGAKLELTVSNAPYLDAMNQFAHLIDYPYGCIEQTTSSAFPLLVMGDLIEWIDSEKTRAEVDEMVDYGVSRILSMQTSSGGFGYWPGSSDADFWGTVYATHMLLTAKEKGYVVAPTALGDALDYLDDQIETASNKDNHYQRSIPYALYVLAKGGRVKKGRILNLAKNTSDWGEQGLENQFLILAALYKVGDDRMVQDFLNNKTLLQPAAMAPVQHKGTFWSAFRSDAMRLALAEEIWPGDKRWDEVADRVARFVKGKTYLTTQERNWALLGLGRRLKGMNIQPVGDVALEFRGRNIKSAKLPDGTPKWTIQNFDGQEALAKFSHSGSGKPFIYAKVTGYAKEFQLPEAKESLIKIERSYFDLKGNPLEETVKQGELVVVEVEINSQTSDTLENAAIVDRIPAGFEIENARLGRDQSISWINPEDVWRPEYVDIRDDRIQFFGDLNGQHKFYYIARAVTPGDFMAPPASAEQMYDPERVAYSGYKRIKVSSD